MQKEISIQITPDKEKDSRYIHNMLKQELEKQGIHEKKFSEVFIKKSIDARRRQVKFFLRYKIYIGESPEDEFKIPAWKKADGTKSVLIIGSGPAGLFGALKLLEKGIKSIIIERGSKTDQRKRDIAQISTKGIVDENSNYCFGEGGAGTFSDGKLYTRSNKKGSIPQIMNIFHHFGADKKITTDAHPHIGTNKLPAIINNMRNFLISMGCEFYFDTKCTDLIIEKDSNGKKTAEGIKTENVKTGEKKSFTADAILLATGHSSFQVYEMISRLAPENLEAKTFAVGVRVEHPRELIDKIQFHGQKENLEAAEYRVVTQQEERGVYSFCMCPGGFVVPSSTEPDGLVVNGMSAAGRNSRWSNSAIVVETRPEDIPDEFKKEAEKEFGTEVMAGLLFRRWIEKITFQNGNGQMAPAQKIKDFLEHKDSLSLPPTSYSAGVVPSRLDKWLPDQIGRRLEKGFRDINRKMKGFISDDCILIASETRTSTPVRICRDKESYESVSIGNLYPAGEGSGYAGGIVSSAMDGENAAIKIAARLTGTP